MIEWHRGFSPGRRPQKKQPQMAQRSQELARPQRGRRKRPPARSSTKRHSQACFSEGALAHGSARVPQSSKGEWAEQRFTLPIEILIRHGHIICNMTGDAPALHEIIYNFSPIGYEPPLRLRSVFVG